MATRMSQDETWCIYSDRQLVDDELYSLWAQFAAGVRIFVLSDSCHSGTVLKQMFYKSLPHEQLARDVRRRRPRPATATCRST